MKFLFLTIVILMNLYGGFTQHRDIIYDGNTNLDWQNNINNAVRLQAWNDAYTYCRNSNDGGYNDWRLPNVNELISIVDVAKSDPAIDDIFSYTSSASYWSSTSLSTTAGRVGWVVGFNSGLSVGLSGESNEQYVRCVRGIAYIPDIIKVIYRTVYDSKTNLLWQDSFDAATKLSTWNDALNYCNNLELNSKTEWRLPNSNELLSILDITQKDPNILHIFEYSSSSSYWTSTTRYYRDGYPDDYKTAWGVNFSRRSVFGGHKNNKYNFRCVHSVVKSEINPAIIYYLLN